MMTTLVINGLAAVYIDNDQHNHVGDTLTFNTTLQTLLLGRVLCFTPNFGVAFAVLVGRTS